MNHNQGLRQSARIIGVRIDASSWNTTISQILAWVKQHEPRTVCLCNVHSAVTARGDEKLAGALDASDMVLPDGAPIAWMLRRYGYKDQTRIAGPDLMERLCDAISHGNEGIFLFGSDWNTLERLKTALKEKYPSLKVAGALSPKFGDWSKELTANYIDAINKSGAGIVFVGLGCPRQEIWMAANSNKTSAVMIGVGAAFDFHAGTIKRAPLIMRHLGLEWLHRLVSEPKRLWKRYLLTNTYFLWLAARDLLQHRSRGKVA